MRTIVSQQVDVLSVIKDMIEMAKNPKLLENISNAHELVRRESALTEAEKEKVDEARRLIKNHQEIVAELHEQKAQFLIDRNQLDKDQALVKADQSKVHEIIKDLESREKAILLKERQLSDLSISLQREKEALGAQEERNLSEQNRLKELDASLKIRGQKLVLREQAADL